MPIWSDALQGRADWNVFIPEKFETMFSNVPNCHVVPALFLNTSIRHDFVDVSPWVEAILQLDLPKARCLYQEMLKQGFDCWYFRDREKLPQAVDYVQENYPGSHTGIVLSSHYEDRCEGLFGPQFTGRRVKSTDAYNWYTQESQTLCRAASEFLIQGIELEYPIVAFTGDFYIQNGKWTVAQDASNPGLQDLETVVKNVYRVLLTRSRKGMFLYIPNSPRLDETFAWFQSMLTIEQS